MTFEVLPFRTEFAEREISIYKYEFLRFLPLVEMVHRAFDNETFFHFEWSLRREKSLFTNMKFMRFLPLVEMECC
ncbi:hypothetical protein HYN59_10315 [Flavobacterium album]|uniref:Uncharacterized protein n=1 Tax=Flavobacterium album TaxID=2175091 RepID=A0A2S1QYI3_9FLAO|nr:hypothetical protein HYN59_10315 [Flavobacterium album]